MLMVNKHNVVLMCLSTALTIKSAFVIANTNQSSASILSQQSVVDVKISDNTQLFIGKKNIDYTSLIYAQDYNQGIVGTMKLDNFNSQLKTFTAGTHHLEGNTLGIEDHNHRASGIIWEYQPVTTAEEAIHFTTSYFSGESQIGNHSGDAISIATDASAFNQRLQLRGEYAQSSFSAIDNNTDAHDQTQQAQHFRIRYIPTTQQDQTSTWDIGIEQKTVEAGFQSVLNHSLASDKNTTRLFGHYEKNNWATEFSLQREENNLKRKLSTTDTIHSGSISGRYEVEAPSEKSKHYFLGKQHYSVHYNQSNKIQHYHWQEITDSPNGNRNQYQALSFEGRHFYSNWQWFYKVGRSFASDRLDDNGHVNSHELEIGSHFPINKLTRIETKIRSFQSKKTRIDLSSSEMHYDIHFRRALIPNTFSGDISLNYHRRDTEVSIDQDERHQAFLLSGRLSQRLLKPKGLYPSIDLDLSASYKQELNVFSEIDKKDYQALMTLKINLAANNAASEIPPSNQ